MDCGKAMDKALGESTLIEIDCGKAVDKALGESTLVEIDCCKTTHKARGESPAQSRYRMLVLWRRSRKRRVHP